VQVLKRDVLRVYDDLPAKKLLAAIFSELVLRISNVQPAQVLRHRRGLPAPPACRRVLCCAACSCEFSINNPPYKWLVLSLDKGFLKPWRHGIGMPELCKPDMHLAMTVPVMP
jgi:hypothetical protein